MDPFTPESSRKRDVALRAKLDSRIRFLATLILVLAYPYLPATAFSMMTLSGSFSQWYLGWVGICAALALIAKLCRF